MAKAKFTVKWTDFTVLKKHDVDRDKPYLWVFGIVVDATSIDSGEYVIRRPSSSDNLGQKFKKGDSVAVPSGLDISRDVTPLFGLASAGVVVVAWENAMTRDKVIADAYDTAADAINEFVTDLVVGLLEDVAGGKPIDEIEVELSPTQMAALQSDVEAKIRATIRSGWSVFQLVHDHNIGQDYTVVTLDEPFEECLDYRFTKGSTVYDLEGDMAYGVPEPFTGKEPDVGDIPVKDQKPKPRAIL